MRKLFLTVFFICLFSSNVYATSHPHAYGGVPSDGVFIERNAYIIQFNPIQSTRRPDGSPITSYLHIWMDHQEKANGVGLEMILIYKGRPQNKTIRISSTPGETMQKVIWHHILYRVVTVIMMG